MNFNNKEYTSGVIILAAILVLIIVGLGPILTIWSLNTLFSLKIAFTFWTWLSVIILSNALALRVWFSSK